MEMKRYAVAAIKRGLRVFQLRPNDKRPLHPGWQQEATLDEATACAMWEATPSANTAW